MICRLTDSCVRIRCNHRALYILWPLPVHHDAGIRLALITALVDVIVLPLLVSQESAAFLIGPEAYPATGKILEELINATRGLLTRLVMVSRRLTRGCLIFPVRLGCRSVESSGQSIPATKKIVLEYEWGE